MGDSIREMSAVALNARHVKKKATPGLTWFSLVWNFTGVKIPHLCKPRHKFFLLIEGERPGDERRGDKEMGRWGGPSGSVDIWRAPGSRTSRPPGGHRARRFRRSDRQLSRTKPNAGQDAREPRRAGGGCRKSRGLREAAAFGSPGRGERPRSRSFARSRAPYHMTLYPGSLTPKRGFGHPGYAGFAPGSKNLPILRSSPNFFDTLGTPPRGPTSSWRSLSPRLPVSLLSPCLPVFPSRYFAAFWLIWVSASLVNFSFVLASSWRISSRTPAASSYPSSCAKVRTVP